MNNLYTRLVKYHRATFSFVLISLLVALPACSTFTSQIAPIDGKKYDWGQTRKEVSKLNSWSLIGKVGIRSASESTTVAINNWSQVGELYNLELSSTFFGIGSSTLIGTNSFITISEAGEDPISSDEPNALIESALGISLPITFLSHWVKALPAPNQPFNIQYNSLGLPASLTQHQWQLKFSKYSEQQGIPLPGKIKLERNGIRIILAVKKWTLPSL